MRSRLAAILIAALLAACSGEPPGQPTPGSPAVTASASVRPTPSATPTLEPRPSGPPGPTIAYDCPLLTLDEITAIVGREISNAYQTERGGCMWNFKPHADAPGVSNVSLHVSPWDSAVFNTNYQAMPPEQRFADVGDGAYWDTRGSLVFLYRDHVCGVNFTQGEGDADQLPLLIEIAQTAIPRMFLD